MEVQHEKTFYLIYPGLSLDIASRCPALQRTGPEGAASTENSGSLGTSPLVRFADRLKPKACCARRWADLPAYGGRARGQPLAFGFSLWLPRLRRIAQRCVQSGPSVIGVPLTSPPRKRFLPRALWVTPISKNDVINSNFSSQKIFTGKL